MRSLEQIDLRLLRIFDAMHANRHATRAAEELGLSQPTISIGLGKLGSSSLIHSSLARPRACCRRRAPML